MDQGAASTAASVHSEDVVLHELDETDTASLVSASTPSVTETQQRGSADSSCSGGGGGGGAGAGTGLDNPCLQANPAAASNDLGKIEYKLIYDFYSLRLTLVIIRAFGLPAKDFSGTSDPYVRIMLLPDRKTKMETSTKKKTLCPTWNESFTFEGVSHQKLQTRILCLQLYDYDQFSRNDPIGEVLLPLSDANMAVPTLYTSPVLKIQKIKERRGELLLSLCYNPPTSKLSVVIIKVKNLKQKDSTILPDPYVKVWLTVKEKKMEKKKTKVVKQTVSPVYNECITYSVTMDKLPDTCLNISVMNQEKLGRNEHLGSFTLANNSQPTEAKHWCDMMVKPRQHIAQWHTLN